MDLTDDDAVPAAIRAGASQDSHYLVDYARALAVVDRVGEGAGAAEQAAMHERVIATSRYEWMFWDAAWRRETWPV